MQAVFSSGRSGLVLRIGEQKAAVRNQIPESDKIGRVRLSRADSYANQSPDSKCTSFCLVSTVRGAPKAARQRKFQIKLRSSSKITILSSRQSTEFAEFSIQESRVFFISAFVYLSEQLRISRAAGHFSDLQNLNRHPSTAVDSAF